MQTVSAIVDSVSPASSNVRSSRRETAQLTRYEYGEPHLPELTDGTTQSIPSQRSAGQRGDEGPDTDASSLLQAPTSIKDDKWMREDMRVTRVYAGT